MQLEVERRKWWQRGLTACACVHGWHVRTDGAHTTKNCSAAAWRSVSRPTATLDAERVRAIRRGRREVARQAASS